LRDLLDSTNKVLSIKENKFGIYCDNLKLFEVNSELETYKYLELGGSQRATSATLMNESSSRSHAIFTI